MLTMFTIPWPTNKAENLIHRQMNALRSWDRLTPTPEVMLCGDEEGIAALAARRRYTHMPHLTEYAVGAPVIPSVFRQAEVWADIYGDVLMYANADDIFFQDLIDAIAVVSERFERFMMIGQKWDIEINEPIDFSEGWQDRLRDRVAIEGELHGGSAVDYYVYTAAHPVGVDFPQFVIGSTGWDTWLVDDTLRRGFAVVDITDAVMCVHQHKYGKRPGGSRNHNRELFLQRLAEQRREYSDVRGKVNHATWELMANGTLREVPDELRGVAREKRDWSSVPVVMKSSLNLPGWNQQDKVKKPKTSRNGKSLSVLEDRGP